MSIYTQWFSYRFTLQLTKSYTYSLNIKNNPLNFWGLFYGWTG